MRKNINSKLFYTNVICGMGVPYSTPSSAFNVQTLTYPETRNGYIAIVIPVNFNTKFQAGNSSIITLGPQQATNILFCSDWGAQSVITCATRSCNPGYLTMGFNEGYVQKDGSSSVKDNTYAIPYAMLGIK